jgi:hypothetical protein
VAEVVNAWLLGLTGVGLAVGCTVLLTTPAATSWRLAATAIVLLAALVTLAAVFAGLVRPPLALIALVLVPALLAVGLRFRRLRRVR